MRVGGVSLAGFRLAPREAHGSAPTFAFRPPFSIQQPNCASMAVLPNAPYRFLLNPPGLGIGDGLVLLQRNQALDDADDHPDGDREHQQDTDPDDEQEGRDEGGE